MIRLRNNISCELPESTFLEKPHQNIPSNSEDSKTQNPIRINEHSTSDCIIKETKSGVPDKNDPEVNIDVGASEAVVSSSSKKCLRSSQEHDPLKMETKLQSQATVRDVFSPGLQPKMEPVAHLIRSKESSTEQITSINERKISNDDPSSRKTSSSSNGSNSTSDSSSSFSSYNLKTLPENPDSVVNDKPTHSKPLHNAKESISGKKSLEWQEDPGQLLNAWLAELESLQQVMRLITLSLLRL